MMISGGAKIASLKHARREGYVNQINVLFSITNLNYKARNFFTLQFFTLYRSTLNLLSKLF